MDFQSNFSPAVMPPSMSPPPAGLTRRRKAAMIVQLLLSDGNSLALQQLPEHLQEELAKELGEIRLVDRDTINAVAAEFTEILESIGMTSPGGIAAALAALSDHISPALARRLQAQLELQSGADPWPRVTALDDEELRMIVTAESIPVGAVLLSKLPVARAARILGMVPGALARKITFAVAQTETIGPDAVHSIGYGLVADYCKEKDTAFERKPADRVGDILNSSPANVRDDVLDGLDSEDEDFAKSVRKTIFTFPNIPDRVRPIDVPTILRVIEGADMSRALSAAWATGGDEAEAAEYILSCISQRMAAQMREDANALATPRPAEADEYMNVISARIRELANEGTINLIEPVEEEEDAG